MFPQLLGAALGECWLTRCFAAPLLLDLPTSDQIDQAGAQKFYERSLTPTFYYEYTYGSAKM